MKRKPFSIMWISAVIVLLFNSLSFPALSNEDFRTANQLYEEGKYAEALSIYHSIESGGIHWKLYYNIGNCYYKLNKFVKAKIYYLKAQKVEAFNDSIKNNIQLVDKILNIKITEEKPDFLTRATLKIESVISMNIISVVFILIIFILNVFIFFLIKKGKSRLLLYGFSFSLLLVFLIGMYHIHRVNRINQENIAVILKPKSELRSGPGDTNTILFDVNPGVKVKIIDTSRDWFQVSASSQIAGWIKKDRLERI
jgi:tetratricopeptide (TPR) repeat protein